MSKPIFASLFTGGDGAGVGAKMAGYDLAWGIEIDPRIADVANRNLGGHVRSGDLLQKMTANYATPDVLWMSPPCPNFSQAKTDAVETEQDRNLAAKSVFFAVVLKPEIVVLENVYQYRDSDSYKIIERALLRSGYSVKFWHVNFANYGVPQTRKRMIMIARRDGRMPTLPAPTHTKAAGLFTGRWVGWHEATQDLHGDCEAAEFAPWQVELLEGEGLGHCSMLAHNGINSDSAARMQGDPSYCITVSNCPDKAFLLNGQNASSARPVSQVGPSPAIVASVEKAPTRAFVANGTPNNNCTELTCCDSEEPIFTITATQEKKPARAWLESGRIIKLSQRCIARLQSFPDWYELPSNKTLAGRIIGNAVPPLGAQRILEGLWA